MKFTNSLSPMNILAFFFTVFTILGSFVVEAVPTAQPEKRDVFVPRITSPVAGDVWNSNQQAQVTWDTSDAPENITNSKGVVVLRRGDLATPGQYILLNRLSWLELIFLYHDSQWFWLVVSISWMVVSASMCRWSSRVMTTLLLVSILSVPCFYLEVNEGISVR